MDALASKWENPRRRPRLWSPVVTVPHDRREPLQARFYTYNRLGTERVEEHVDRYPQWAGEAGTGRYVCEPTRVVIAWGREGYVF